MRLLLVVMMMMMMIDVFYHSEVMTSAKLGDSKLMSMVLPGFYLGKQRENPWRRTMEEPWWIIPCISGL